MADKVRDYANLAIDPAKIDRESRIPESVIKGLGELGVYRLTIPTEFGGLGFNQQMYLKTMDVLGGHDASVAVFVNAHHSIGARALLLFGTKEQQARWLPGLLDGSKLCAFALTEPEAGSDAGRTTFGASCTGHAKASLKAMIDHAKKRVQFQQPLAEFQLVQKKIAFAAAHTFAMEAATEQCAAFIDRGFEDYMLETAILKIFATEHLWTIVNDTIQVWGGKAYFCDQPLERWMRDARINTIGEGANDVLKAFISVVGCKGPGEYLKSLRDDVLGGRWSLRKLGAALGVGVTLALPWTVGTP